VTARADAVPPAALPAAAQPPPSPYRGLRPYTEADTAFFFGREAEGEIVAANLLAARLTLLYGPSGVGKSSVLLAGVVSSLRQRSRENLADEDAAGFAVVVVRSWSDPDPLKTIAAAMRTEAVTLLGRDDLPEPPSDATLAEVLDHWSAQVKGKLLVLFDQFEEYFLYHDHERGPGTFDAEFPRAANRAELRTHFLLSIRDDSLARLDRFKGRIPNLFDNRLQIDHLTLTAARDAVKLPIEEYNRRVPPERRVEIEEELVNDVLDQVRTDRVSRESEGAGAVRDGGAAEARVETPILQVVLTDLWDREAKQGSRILHAQTLVELGGAAQLVRDRLDQRMKTLDPGEQDVAADVARFLVTPSGMKIAYTAADLTQLAYPKPDLAASKFPQVESVLEKLEKGDARILRPVQPLGGDGPPRYELFHDILAEPILVWRQRYVQQREQKAEAQRQREEQEAEAKRQHETARRRQLVALAVVLFSLLSVFAGLAFLALRARDDARQAERSAASMALSIPASKELSKHLDVSLLLSLAAYRASPTFEATASMISALEAAARSGVKAILQSFQDPSGVAFSPDGSMLAVSGSDGTVQLWDLGTQKQLGQLRGPAGTSVTEAAFSPDGQRLAVFSSGGTVRLWNVDTQNQLGQLDGLEDTNAVAFGPDGSTLAVGGSDGTVRLWDVRKQKQLGKLDGPKDAFVNSVAFGPEGGKLAVAVSDGTVRLWDVRTQKPLGKLDGPKDAFVNAIAFGPEGSKLAVAGSGGTVRLWEVATQKQLGQLNGPKNPNAVAFSPDGNTLAVAGSDATVRLWDLRTQTPLAEALTGPEETTASVAFSPDGRTLVAAFDANAGTPGDYGTVRLWEIPLRTRFGQPLAGPKDAFVNAVAFGPDGNKLAVADSGGTVRLWDVARRKQLGQLEGPPKNPNAVAFSPDGNTLAVTGSDRTVRLWDVDTQNELGQLNVPEDTSVTGVAFSSDGHTLAAGGSDGSVRLWNVESQNELDRLNGPKGTSASGVAFSSDGHTLAAGGSDGTVRLWDVDEQKELGRLNGPTGSRQGTSYSVSGVAFSPDGHTLAVTGSDGKVRLWDVGTAKTLGRPLDGRQGSIQGPLYSVYGVAFSPDGRTLAVADSEAKVRLWDVDSQTELGQPLTGAQGVTGVAVSADGTLASGSYGSTVSLWEGVLWKDEEALKERVCSLVWGNLSKLRWDELTHVGYRASCD
jgi:WD40 repeat protein